MPVPKLQSCQQLSLVAHPTSTWYMHRYRLLTGVSVILVLALTMLIPHNQRRLHMPEPWSYALAAQNFAQGNWYSFLGV